jgi:hypothetical protein
MAVVIAGLAVAVAPFRIQPAWVGQTCAWREQKGRQAGKQRCACYVVHNVLRALPERVFQHIPCTRVERFMQMLDEAGRKRRGFGSGRKAE